MFIKERKIGHHKVGNSNNESLHTVKKAVLVVKAQLLNDFILQSSRAKFNSLVCGICPLCHNGEEDSVHFISACEATKDIRNNMKNNLLNTEQPPFKESKYNTK